MEVRVKVRSDGYHMIASFPSVNSPRASGGAYRSWKSELFDRYYLEAQQKEIPRRKIAGYVEDRIREECDISDWLSTEDCQRLSKNKYRNHLKRRKRFEHKAFLVDFNWFVTFTYDSTKETEESFEKRLKKCFSNFKTRKDWLVMCVPEEGEENGRKHFHAFIRIPKGGMVGKLYLRTKYSRKRRKRETWTDNDYFSERFGISVWKAIDRNDLRSSHLRGYLIKYLEKSGNRIFYSRGIPTELDMVIDTEKDIFAMCLNYVYKAILHDSLFMDLQKDEESGCFFMIGEEELPGYTLDDVPKVA